MIGLLTPPVGMVLYVLTRVADISFEDCLQACVTQLLPLLLLVLITLIPETVLWMPRFLKELGSL
jgi:TRAP-type C4-dicarboxylate transport system permease large subunit